MISKFQSYQSRLFTLTVVLFVVCVELCAQKSIEQGQFTMEMTDLQFIPEYKDLDPDILEQMRSRMSDTEFTAVFDKDIVVYRYVEPGLITPDTVLTHIDLIKRQIYSVSRIGYTRDSLYSTEAEPFFEAEIVSKIPLDEKKFGLSQVEYTCVGPQVDTVKLVVTEDLDLPAVLPSSMINLAKSGTVLYMNMTIDIFSLTYEMTSFDPEIKNVEYMSTDFDVLPNMTELVDNLSEGDTEYSEWRDERSKAFEEYMPQGKNLELLEPIVADGYLKKEIVDSYSSESSDIDVPVIIELLSRIGMSGKSYFDRRGPLNVVSDFKKWSIYSPSMAVILKDTTYWRTTDTYEKSKLLRYAAIYDNLQNQESREQIVNNGRLIGFFSDENNGLDQKFINGEIGIDDWYDRFDVLSVLPDGKSLGDDELVEVIRSMLDNAFRDQTVEWSVSQVETDIVIQSSGVTHEMPIDEFYSIDYDGDYDEATDSYPRRDYVQYDEEFYNKIINKINQVAADNGLPQGHHLYITENLLSSDLDDYEYDNLIERFPSLDFHDRRIYQQGMTKFVYDVMARLNMTVPHQPDIFSSIHSFGPYLRPMDGYEDLFVGSQAKLKFINFLRDNADTYDIDLSRLEQDSAVMVNTLMNGSSELTRFLGPIRIAVDKYYSPTVPRSEYSKEFTKDNDGLAYAYPAIYSVVKDDFPISDFRYDKMEHLEYFSVGGEEVSIVPGAINMMNILKVHADLSKSGKKFFRENTLSISEEAYYYFLPEHADFLIDLLNLPI